MTVLFHYKSEVLNIFEVYGIYIKILEMSNKVIDCLS